MKQAADQRALCLLYTSDAADERSSVDLGGRRIIKKKQKRYSVRGAQDTRLYREYTNDDTSSHTYNERGDVEM